MSNLPYLQLWPKDYLADTRHLTVEQHGAYMLLMMEAWLRPSCSLPDDDDVLAKLAGMTRAQWAKNKDAVLAFWKRDGRSKEWTQKRLQKERKKAVSKKRKASDSAASRWNVKEKDNANAMRTQCSPDNREQKDTNVSFNARARGKKTGFVKQRNAADAAVAYIERKGLNNDTRSTGANSEVSCDDVSQLPRIINHRR